jgi:hypothetical protein
MDVVATDLDRTLLPNGKQPYDETMPLFGKLVKSYGFPLIYVTGRNTHQIRAGIREYDPPLPRYAVAEVGTRVYEMIDGRFVEDEGYIDFIRQHTPDWDINGFRRVLSELSNLRTQEDFNQNQFKLSYYVDRLEQASDIVAEVEQRVRTVCEQINIIYSVDETIGQGLLDILPMRANKMEGLEHVRKKLAVSQDDLVFCGDSGNDLQPLTFGYRAVLVRNAIDEVREKVRRVVAEKGFPEKVYFAKGHGKLNGNYVSGVIEGMLHFGLISEDDVA